jgi:uncharacterized protein
MTDTRIMLASGNLFDLANPDASDFTLHDIAWGMAHVCRFAGQVSRFYSVAEHCVLVSKLVPPEYRRAALLHDASEAFIGDVSRPLKAMLPDYRAIEAQVELAVFRRFLPDHAVVATAAPNPWPAIKAADMAMAMAEAKLLMPGNPDYWNLTVDPEMQARAHSLNLHFDQPEFACRKWLQAWNRAGHQGAAIPERAAA